jgi:glycosyltransferase involved in cell wall biosynthesis
MRILLALTYYRPHISGLTIYVERLGRTLADRGHHVTVLTSRYSKDLPRSEEVDGVRVVRIPVAFRISKGVVMPTYGIEATRHVLAHDVLSVHLPQLEAWELALCGRLLRRPCVLTYHCDVKLPAGAINRAAEWAVGGANALAARLSDRLVAYTDDYAGHAPLLRRHAAKVEVIGPPVAMRRPSSAEVADFRRVHGLGGAGPLIGLAARFAAEKGIDVLLASAPALLERFPDATFVFAGPYEGIVGEHAYRKLLTPAIERLGPRWRFLGPLDPMREMPAFFGAVDCLVVSSVNSTESFGLVQVEAMLCGTAVVASDLPGVRQPIRLTGMGEVVPVGDAPALAEAVTRVLTTAERYLRPYEEIVRLFDPARTIDAYEELFGRLLSERSPRVEAAADHEPT